MKSLLLASVALVATASATTVFAADLIIEEPAAPIVEVSTMDWAGPYIGVHAGFGSGTVNWDFTGAPDSGDEYDIDGWLVGVQAGYNWQMDGGFVLGVEGDLSWSNIGGEDENFPDDEVTRSIDWTGSIRGRAGVAFDSILLYGTAGLAFASSSADVFEDSFGGSDSATHLGWTAGIGAEVLVTEDVSLRGEYRYTNYGEEDYDFGGIPITTSFDTHTVTVGLNFHF